MLPYEEIDSINFGHYSSEEIVKNAVCEITETKLTGSGSLYDERMGTLNQSGNCLSCKLNYTECPGHGS